MKVGILTFHNVRNYGGVLQCFALQQKLLSLGFECEVINYENAYLKKRYSPFFMEKISLKKIAYMIYALKSRIKTSRQFENFRNEYLKLSDVYYTPDNISLCDKNYDAIIVGSDQVWNLELSGMDDNYFLGFAPSISKYSYAASFGMKAIPDNLQIRYKQGINNLNVLSVREASGQTIIRELCGKQAEIHIDPVFLPEKKIWYSIMQGIKSLDENYILVYKINKSDCYIAAKKLSKMLEVPVKVICADKTCPSEFQKQKYTSPQQFIRLFHDAKYVITDSFHGTAFSIIFRKPFYVFLDKSTNNRNSRQIDLLTKLGLDDRMLRNVQKINCKSDIDYAFVEKIILQERKKAEYYLNNMRKLVQ